MCSVVAWGGERAQAPSRRKSVMLIPMHVRTAHAARVALGLVLGLAWTARANAEQPPPWDASSYCLFPFVAPRPGGTVPGNTPAFPFRLTSYNSDFVLRTSVFALVPTTEIADTDPWTLPTRLLVPTRATPTDSLPEGSYAFHFKSSCGPISPTPDGSWTKPFLLGPPAPLPTIAGTLRLVEPVHTNSDTMYCVGVSAIAQLEAVFDPKLVPFLPTTRVRVLGKGVIQGDDEYGAKLGDHYAFGVRANCRKLLDLGPRTLELRAHVAGLGDLVAASLDLDLVCASDAFATCVEAPVVDASPNPHQPDAGAGEGADSDDSTSCSFERRTTAATLAPLTWLAIAMLLHRRRGRSTSHGA
jgi:hypothetical protein